MSERRTYITKDEQKRYENLMDAISDLRIVLAQQGHAMMAFALHQMFNEMDNLMTVWINRMSSQSSPEADFVAQRANEIMKEAFSK